MATGPRIRCPQFHKAEAPLANGCNKGLFMPASAHLFSFLRVRGDRYSNQPLLTG